MALREGQKQVSVIFEPENIAFLERMAEKYNWSNVRTVNEIVRTYASISNVAASFSFGKDAHNSEVFFLAIATEDGDEVFELSEDSLPDVEFRAFINEIVQGGLLGFRSVGE